MRKIMFVITAALLLMVQGAAANTNAALRGDVNDDGEQSVADVMMLVNHIMGITSENFKADRGDLNGDNNLTIADVMILVDIVLNGDSNTVFDVDGGDTGIGYGGGGDGGEIGGPARMPRKQ